MNKKFFVILISFMLIVFFSTCKKKEVKTEPVKEPVVEKVEEITPKVEKPVLTEEEIFQKRNLEEANKAGYLKKIHFDFDKYYIKDDMKPILHSNAEWLLKHPNVEILVEGHCDERGTIEYNIALGEKRADATKNYLVSLGVPELRTKIISYGKSKPLVRGVDEETYYQNRRSAFTIVKK